MSRNRRGGLGRGLGALIPTSPEPAAEQADHRVSAVLVQDRPYDAAHVGGGGVEPATEVVVDRPAIDDGGPLPIPGADYAELPIAQITAK